MSEPLRWGLISTARINRSLIPPLRASSRNTLVAVASRDAERARRYADEWGIDRSYGSYEALLDDPEIDVVYNPLPNHLHAEWSIRAAEAGKHVLCEKPLALSLVDVDAMTAAARKAGVVLAEAFMYRHHARTLRVRQMVRDGELGTIRLVHGVFTFSLNRPNDVRLDPALGGGSLWDVGCYPVSFARTVLGDEPEEVFGQQVVGPTGVDLAFAGQMRFPNDVLVQFDCGFNAPFRMHVTIVGTEGVLDVPRAYKPGVESTLVLRRGDDETVIPVEGGELYRGEIEDLADAVLEGRTPRVTLADSRANTMALLALYHAAQENRPIRLPLQSDDGRNTP